MSAILDALPPPLRRFTTGPWPWAWLGAGCAFGVLGYAAPALMDEAKLREQAALQRGLVERQEAVAAQAPSHEVRREALAAWWREGAGQRIRAASQAAAVAKAQDEVRKACERAGVRVERLEAGRVDALTDAPTSALVMLNLTLVGERMEAVAEALRSLEDAPSGKPTPWLRLGNMTVLATGVRFITGVKVETTVYAMVEAGAGA